MRLRSDIFVSAMVRRVFAESGFAVIERKGARDAGAIAIRQVQRDGSETLFMPAPQSFSQEGDNGRIFEKCIHGAEEISARLEKETRFDRDLWIVVVEIETVDGVFELVSEGA